RRIRPALRLHRLGGVQHAILPGRHDVEKAARVPEFLVVPLRLRPDRRGEEEDEGGDRREARHGRFSFYWRHFIAVDVTVHAVIVPARSMSPVVTVTWTGDANGGGGGGRRGGGGMRAAGVWPAGGAGGRGERARRARARSEPARGRRRSGTWSARPNSSR